MKPGASAHLHVIIENTTIAIEVLRPIFWQRGPESLFGHPQEVVIHSWVDAKISCICDELGLRWSWALFPPNELIDREYIHICY
jgi:hypothetical protein